MTATRRKACDATDLTGSGPQPLDSPRDRVLRQSRRIQTFRGTRHRESRARRAHAECHSSPSDRSRQPLRVQRSRRRHPALGTPTAPGSPHLRPSNPRLRPRPPPAKTNSATPAQPTGSGLKLHTAALCSNEGHAQRPLQPPHDQPSPGQGHTKRPTSRPQLPHSPTKPHTWLTANQKPTAKHKPKTNRKTRQDKVLP